MIKISNRDIIDVVKYNDSSAIIVEKVPLIDESAKYKVNYFVVNFESGQKDVITKSAYLLSKFGTSYEKICSKINNFVQCKVSVLQNKNILCIYPNGEAGIFDTDGEIVWSGSFEYKENCVCGIAEDNEYFWSFCNKENCIIRYNSENMNVDLRIGDKESETFVLPFHISQDAEFIYVCCEPNKIRQVNKNTLAVSDYAVFNGYLKSYYKFNYTSVICMENACFLHTEKD